MKKIIYLIIILALVGAGFYLWQNRHKYFFQGEAPYEVYNDDDKVNNQPVDNDGNSVVDPNGAENINSSDSENENIPAEGENQALLDILRNHCDNKCEDKRNTADYNYCLEICGLSATGTSSSDCGNLSSDFEKDVCYKNQAIKEKNSGICNSIKDSRLKDNCKDRVLEELFS